MLHSTSKYKWDFSCLQLLCVKCGRPYSNIVKDVLTSCDSTLDNRISGILVSVLASSAVDRGFEPRSSQTWEYKIGICCFSAKHAALRSKSKDWLAQNQNNVSKWSDMSTRGLSFQWASTLKKTSKRVGLEQSGPHHHLIKY